MALLCTRCSPIDRNLGSQAELLYGRNLRTNLPTHRKGSETISETLRNKREKQAAYYNRDAKDLPELHIGQPVALQDAQTLRWTKATVVDKDNHRSYTVETDNGSTFRRNRRHLKDLPSQRTPSNVPVGADASLTMLSMR